MFQVTQHVNRDLLWFRKILGRCLNMLYCQVKSSTLQIYFKKSKAHQCIGVAFHSKVKISGVRSATLDLQSPDGPISVDDYERYLEMVMVDFCMPLNKQFTCQINSLQKLCAEKLVVMACNWETHPIRIIGKFNKIVYNCSHVKR